MLVVIITLSLPLVASAQLTNTEGLLQAALRIVNSTLIPIAFALAVLFFFWGVALYVLKSGEQKDEGKKIMVWGVIALFVMTSVWGLVRFIQRELLPNTSFNALPVPTLNTGGGGGSGGDGGGVEFQDVFPW
jgi:amino acid transporter